MKNAFRTRRVHTRSQFSVQRYYIFLNLQNIFNKKYNFYTFYILYHVKFAFFCVYFCIYDKDFVILQTEIE